MLRQKKMWPGYAVRVVTLLPLDAYFLRLHRVYPNQIPPLNSLFLSKTIIYTSLDKNAA